MGVALRWVVQSGCAFSVRPTTDFGLGRSTCEGTSCRTGLEERRQIFDWSLTPQEMAEINARRPLVVRVSRSEGKYLIGRSHLKRWPRSMRGDLLSYGSRGAKANI